MDVRYIPSKSMSLAMVLLTVLVVATPTGVVQGIEWQVPLQKHVAFFDRNNDGIVYPSETFEGFRAIGAGIPLSTAAAVIINTGLSSTTRPGKGVDLNFPIEIENIALAKHTSDSGAYDNEGRFVLSKFEEIFSKHAYTKPDALSSTELDKMLKANMKPNNKKGGFNAFIEWKVIFQLAKDKDGFLHKETLRKVYDGTLFYDMEKHQKEKLASKKKA